MRPQIRSIPLCKAECPQFSWVVRNNSENICEVLQPDFYCDSYDSRYQETESSKFAKKSCRCVQSFKPTLFPHPVACVCSTGPCAPPNDKYRRYKLKMDQTIGEVMEDMILNNVCSPPTPIREPTIKKTIRSAYPPKKASYTNEEKCDDYLKLQMLLKELMDKMKCKKEPVDYRVPCECNKGEEKSFASIPKTLSDEGVPDSVEDHICDCKNPPKTQECEEKCKKVGVKCPCEEPTSPEQKIEPDSPRKDTSDKQEAKKEKKQIPKTPTRTPKREKKRAESPTRSPKSEKKKAEPPIRSPKREKSVENPTRSLTKTVWKRPGNIICEKLELSSKYPYEDEFAETTKREPSQVTIYEHFRASRLSRSSSSLSSSLTWEINKSRQPHCSEKDSASQKTTVRLPWNWQNQRKPEETSKKFYSWNKRASRDSSFRKSKDVAKKEESRSKMSTHKASRENEEDLEQKEYWKSKGNLNKVKAKNWHQQLEENRSRNGQRGNKQKMQFSESYSEGSDEDEDNRVHTKVFSNENNRHGPGCFKSRFKVCTNLDVDQRRENTVDAKLSTITEENSMKTASRSNETIKAGHRLPVRPKTAYDTETESAEENPFNIIKQKIRSRYRRLRDLDIFNDDPIGQKPPRDHTCVHRFTIDDRLYPVPLHCDESGASCCVQCDKPMPASDKSVFVDQRRSRTKVNDRGGVRKEVPKARLRPRTVHMGTRNSVLEVKLGPEHEDLLKGYGGGKRVFYPDSMALRHQRR